MHATETLREQLKPFIDPNAANAIVEIQACLEAGGCISLLQTLNLLKTLEGRSVVRTTWIDDPIDRNTNPDGMIGRIRVEYK